MNAGQSLKSPQEAAKVVRAAKLPALLGGFEDRLMTDGVCWSVVRLASNVGSQPLRLNAQKTAATALRIRFNARARSAVGFLPSLGMSWGDVWASATGIPEFGAAVEAQAVNPVSRQLRSDVVVRVEHAARIGLWDSPVGKTLGKRPQHCRVVPVDAVEVDSNFLTASVALDWAAVRLERAARRLAEILEDCEDEREFVKACGGRSTPAAGKAAAKQVWQVYSKARDEAAAAAATASGKVDWNKAPCVGGLLSGVLKDELKNDLRFGLAIVLEEAARRSGGHARSMFPIESLGALYLSATASRRKELASTLNSMARKTPGALSKCTVIASRTMRGVAGLKCPASSCDACHRAAGIPATTPPEDVTPGMVAAAASLKL